MDKTNDCVTATSTEMNIWRTKLENEFPQRPYFNWWSPEENYKLQSQSKMWCCWSGADTQDINSMLYTPNPVYKRLLALASDKIHYGMGYDNDRFAEIDFTVAHKQYLILKDEECELTVVNSYDTVDECKAYLREEVFGQNLNRDDYDLPDYFVVNLGLMCFDFSNTHTDKICFASISVYGNIPIENILLFNL